MLFENSTLGKFQWPVGKIGKVGMFFSSFNWNFLYICLRFCCLLPPLPNQKALATVLSVSYHLHCLSHIISINNSAVIFVIVSLFSLSIPYVCSLRQFHHSCTCFYLWPPSVFGTHYTNSYPIVLPISVPFHFHFSFITILLFHSYNFLFPSLQAILLYHFYLLFHPFLSG